MRSRALLMLLVALLAGLAAVVMAARWMQGQGVKRTQVAVAAMDVGIGQPLTGEMIRLADWPEGSIPQGAFHTVEKLPGRVALTSLARGEPILDARLAPEGTKGGLSAVVPQGKRAMTVRVNDVVGVAGFALPGTYVDVLVSTQEDTRRGANAPRDPTDISKIVLERILVLAVAQEADRDATKPKVVNAVTLEVTPDQAEKLDLARTVGQLSLVLRNQTETTATVTQGITKADLLGRAASAPAAVASAPVVVQRVVRVVKVAPPPAPAPAPVVAKPTNCVEVIRGFSKVTECF